VTQPSGPGPTIIPPPKPVAAAGLLACAQSLGVVVLTVIILISGFSHSAAVGQLLAQAAYFMVFAGAIATCGLALLRGRRWGRTPTIVVQIILVAVGYWMTVPSSRPGWGVPLIVLGLVTAGLLLTPAAIDWISRFPSLFGPEPDR
jgi:hypothetical protein